MTRRQDPKKGLGRGLSALLGDLDDEAEASGAVAPESPVATLPIERIQPNPAQPRRDFDEAELDELAASIAERGVIQPIVVRPDPDSADTYQIVAGERRWRAAQRAQLHEMPVVVRALEDRDMLELAIVENVQRSDLNPIEEATGYARLIESFGYTQDALARVIGKSRSHLANLMRLLSLPDEVQRHVRDGALSAGHARALIAAEDPAALAAKAIRQGLTVRQLEQAAKAGGGAGRAGPGARASGAPQKDADTRLLEGDLSAAIGMKVEIRHGNTGGGELRISYRSLEDLDQICRKLAE